MTRICVRCGNSFNAVHFQCETCGYSYDPSMVTENFEPPDTYTVTPERWQNGRTLPAADEERVDYILGTIARQSHFE